MNLRPAPSAPTHPSETPKHRGKARARCRTLTSAATKDHRAHGEPSITRRQRPLNKVKIAGWECDCVYSLGF
ncbi:hypothetical protein E2C01_074939 [Portunus trituberculatus]|uniref:Uncharacterized protein n=1 Tax=Portunus trituberculatus TaxID=210409 RepID=A0A5B7I4S4_PORTR|nr:hypothetical protein [Portunus trituberculatus]